MIEGILPKIIESRCELKPSFIRDEPSGPHILGLFVLKKYVLQENIFLFIKDENIEVPYA